MKQTVSPLCFCIWATAVLLWTTVLRFPQCSSPSYFAFMPSSFNLRYPSFTWWHRLFNMSWFISAPLFYFEGFFLHLCLFTLPVILPFPPFFNEIDWISFLSLIHRSVCDSQLLVASFFVWILWHHLWCHSWRLAEFLTTPALPPLSVIVFPPSIVNWNAHIKAFL